MIQFDNKYYICKELFLFRNGFSHYKDIHIASYQNNDNINNVVGDNNDIVNDNHRKQDVVDFLLSNQEIIKQAIESYNKEGADSDSYNDVKKHLKLYFGGEYSNEEIYYDQEEEEEQCGKKRHFDQLDNKSDNCDYSFLEKQQKKLLKNKENNLNQSKII